VKKEDSQSNLYFCSLVTNAFSAAQESNSVLLPSLSRNRFSLDSIPVAKLKKSSKNPFSSQEGNEKPKKRGRPRKVKPE
jgi:hypothetical protein